MGKTPILKHTTLSDEMVMDRAMAKLELDEKAGEKLVDELIQKHRPIDEAEAGLLLHRDVDLQNQRDRAALNLQKLGKLDWSNMADYDKLK